MTGGIQTQVGAQQAIAVAGDWASGNPRAFVNAGQAGLVAGPAGLTVGAFAWLSGTIVDDRNAPAVANNFGSGPVSGFVHRQQQGLNTVFLSDATMTIPGGFPVALMSGGDVFVTNSGSASTAPGQKAYANFANGLATFAATGSPTSASSTTSTIAAGATTNFTGSISGNVLTLLAGGSGTIALGGIISGTNVATGTQILSLLSGTLGVVGSTYSVSIPEQAVASTLITETWGVLTLGGAPTGGAFGPGGLVSGGTTSANTIIFSQLSGSGGAGSTYLVNNTQTVASATLTATTNVETHWYAQNTAAVGELVVLSDRPPA